jgi:hypothetical protein
MSTSDARMWAAFSHLGVLLAWIPMATVLVPLIVWMVHRDKDAFVEGHGRAALNFQLTMLFGFLAGYLLGTIGVFVLIAVGAVNLLFSILAAIAALQGNEYRYPFSLELVK